MLFILSKKTSKPTKKYIIFYSFQHRSLFKENKWQQHYWVEKTFDYEYVLDLHDSKNLRRETQITMNVIRMFFCFLELKINIHILFYTLYVKINQFNSFLFFPLYPKQYRIRRESYLNLKHILLLILIIN